MFEGLIWLFASVASACVLIYMIPKSIISTMSAYRTRNMEPATVGQPSSMCPTCAGKWGPWSKIQEESRPNNPSYPSTGGHHILRSQTRMCTECGVGERRVLG